MSSSCVGQVDAVNLLARLGKEKGIDGGIALSRFYAGSAE